MDALSDFFKKNKIYNCVVKKIYPTYIIVQTAGVTGICHISEVSDYKVNDINHFFKVNESYNFLLLEFNEAKGLYSFSYKRINPKLLKHHTKIIPTTSGYKNLYNNTMEKLYKNK